MKIRFILGPAGSGKTHRCLDEIRSLLAASPRGKPLILLAPKQATFQLERQLFSGNQLSGYARLQILSFERLAEFALNSVRCPMSALFSDDGRLMVLRSLLAKKHDELKVFRSTARLPGFSQELLKIINEFQRCRLTPALLRKHAARLGSHSRLGMKLEDAALMMDAYREWLHARELGDTDSLLETAADALHRYADASGCAPIIDSLWMDGFADLTPQELHLLAALAPNCDSASLAFCLDAISDPNPSWTSTWSMTSRSYRLCHAKLASIPSADVQVQLLERNPALSRFAASCALQQLEQNWSLNTPAAIPSDLSVAPPAPDDAPSSSIRLISCSRPDAEVEFAAREITHHAKQGGRYRDCAVLLRQFTAHEHLLRRIFKRHKIPFFLDRREAITHHPLAELVRYAMRTAALGWAHDDWFGMLKTGLMPVDEDMLDRLENAALAAGWDSHFWRQPVLTPASKIHPDWMDEFHRRVVQPVMEFESALRTASGPKPGDTGVTGLQLAAALKNLWKQLEIENRLQQWAEARLQEDESLATGLSQTVHATVWQQMHQWLHTLTQAFSDIGLGLLEWLPIIESGLSGMTVGVIPPSLDQVLIGVVDRSRNPDLKLTLVLGMNETIFPAAPASGGILSTADRERLSCDGVELGPDHRLQLGREKYLAYIACTRCREKLVLTWAETTAEDRPIHVSPYIAHIRSLLPSIPIEHYAGIGASDEPLNLPDSMPGLIEYFQHRDELPKAENPFLADHPGLCEAAASLAAYPAFGSLSSATAGSLYGKRLALSVSSLESFAACPFQFFVSVALRGRERDILELDEFEKGSFMHEILAHFDREVRKKGKRWRDLTPAEAKSLAADVIAEDIRSFRNGLFTKTRMDTLSAQSLGQAVTDYLAVAVRWMAQYQFDPAAVELPFGMEQLQEKQGISLSAWELDLDEGRSLALRGKIDRVDAWVSPAKDQALCVVMDYKSSGKQLDRALSNAGIQLQLPVYLNVLRHAALTEPVFGALQLQPAGVFYINLRGDFSSGKTRSEVLSDLENSQLQAYKHRGRFDSAHLPLFDNQSGGQKSAQFAYSINQDGSLSKKYPDPMTTEDFHAFLNAAERKVVEFGRSIYTGSADVAPYKKGSVTACDHCQFASICRIDPWTHEYRSLPT